MVAFKTSLARTWAFLATPIILATFAGKPFFSRVLAEKTDVKISPWYTGGDVMREIKHPGYRTVLRQPVFEGLVRPHETGFIQIEWFPDEGSSLPTSIFEAVDVNGTGECDFEVNLDTTVNRVVITAKSHRILGLDHVYNMKRERVIRVALRRT